MRYVIAIITIMAICSCKSANRMGDIEVVFSPGFVEYDILDEEPLNTVLNSTDKPDRMLKIKSNDSQSLHDALSFKNKEETSKLPVSPCILVKLNSIIYIIGTNKVVMANNKTYYLSAYDYYKVKCITHYFDYFDSDELRDMNEIKSFGMPENYNYSPSDPKKAPKPFVKIVLSDSL